MKLRRAMDREIDALRARAGEDRFVGPCRHCRGLGLVAYPHGTPSAYSAGCKCPICRTAETERVRLWREEHPIGEGDPRHGTTAGYTAGCRRGCCLEAKREYNRARSARLAAEREVA